MGAQTEKIEKSELKFIKVLLILFKSSEKYVKRWYPLVGNNVSALSKSTKPTRIENAFKKHHLSAFHHFVLKSTETLTTIYALRWFTWSHHWELPSFNENQAMVRETNFKF